MNSALLPRSDRAQDELDVTATDSRVLIIDDDEIHTHLCKRYLRAEPEHKYSIVSVTTIKEAIATVHVDKFNCIIVDYGLPDGNGTEAIRQLKETLGEKMPRTIVLTAERGGQPAIEALRQGVGDYMTKDKMTSAALCRCVANAVEKNNLEMLNIARVKELEQTNALLTKRNEEIKRFYHTVSHEVKTPLTAIQEFVSIVHDGIAGELLEEQKTILEYALEGCDQIKLQFNELLELSRFETGKMQVSLQAESIYNVLDHCVVPATPKAHDKNIDLIIDDAQDLPLVLMQSNRIIQVLSNLIGNALKFTPPNGSVWVHASLVNDGAAVRISVKDTGCGIPAQHMKKVFDRLYQVTPASDRENESGMGLGLSIAAQIVELHGGTINLESTIGNGSEFSFELATADAEEQQPKLPAGLSID